MRKVTRFELEDTTYVGGGKMDVEATFADGRFTFKLDGRAEFEIGRDELEQLIDETETGEDGPQVETLVYFETVAQVEMFLHRHRGRVVSLCVRRKSGVCETREFECYRIVAHGGRTLVVAFQLDHQHFERIPLCTIEAGRARFETFSPRDEVTL